MKSFPRISATLAALAAVALSGIVTTNGFVIPTSSSSLSGSANAQQQSPLQHSTSLSATTATETETSTNPRLYGLALALDEGTRKSHSMAQNSAFVQGFFKGISSPDSYKNLLTSLYYVYRAMEVEVLDVVKAQTTNDSRNAQWIRSLDVDTLRRLPGLEQDMEYFYGNDWRTQMDPPSKGTIEYVKRIQELATSLVDNDNEKKSSLLYLFVAHQYTRYLGDLFGGQMMGSMASKSMDLPDDGISGVAFYTFEDVPSTKDFITEWYTTLNGLEGLTTQEQEAIVDEANLVFDLNIGILQELEGSPWKALWTMAVKSAKEFTDWSQIKESKNGSIGR